MKEIKLPFFWFIQIETKHLGICKPFFSFTIGKRNWNKQEIEEFKKRGIKP